MRYLKLHWDILFGPVWRWNRRSVNLVIERNMLLPNILSIVRYKTALHFTCFQTFRRDIFIFSLQKKWRFYFHYTTGGENPINFDYKFWSNQNSIHIQQHKILWVSELQLHFFSVSLFLEIFTDLDHDNIVLPFLQKLEISFFEQYLKASPITKPYGLHIQVVLFCLRLKDGFEWIWKKARWGYEADCST